MKEIQGRLKKETSLKPSMCTFIPREPRKLWIKFRVSRATIPTHAERKGEGNRIGRESERE